VPAIAALFFPAAEHVALARRQLVKRRALVASVRGDERLDHLGIHDRAALGDRADRADELVDVVDALLEQVGAALAPVLEQRQRVPRLRVLAEHDDADPRVALAQEVGRADALVGPGRRHPDVGDDDVRPLGLDCGEQRVQVVAGGDDLDVGLRLEQAARALADEVVVVGDDDAQRHARSLGRSGR